MGRVWLALTQCNTDEDVMQLFLSKLAQCLTADYGVGWRDDIVMLLDGATYHRSEVARQSFLHLSMKVVISAPYSYAGAVAELWFAHIKQGCWNPDGIKTGKN